MGERSRALARKRRHLRVRRKVFGTAQRPRLDVFKSLSEIYAQLIDDVEGRTLVSASTVDRDVRGRVEGMKKADQAREVGRAVAARAKEKGIDSIVFDRGGNRYVGRVKALADGAREGGLKF
jgi:large subunit ribosomal protein L18